MFDEREVMKVHSVPRILAAAVAAAFMATALAEPATQMTTSGAACRLPETASAPATSAASPSSAPATAATTAPAAAARREFVQWHAEYEDALAEAKAEGRPLLVIYYDPFAPGWEDLREKVLPRRATRRALADFAAVPVDVTGKTGKKLFQAAGEKVAPVTQVRTPGGELLDTIPGCPLPPERYRNRLDHSLELWRASTTRPASPKWRWKAVQARLELSTRAKAVDEIAALLKLPAEDLPEGVTPARLHHAKALALELSDPEKAREALAAAGEADGAKAIAGDVLLLRARMLMREGEDKAAHALYGRYIRQHPDGGGLGEAVYYKAVLDTTAMDDKAAAVKGLKEFIADHPDDPWVVRVKSLLEALEAS
jgi:hypothetical protein